MWLDLKSQSIWLISSVNGRIGIHPAVAGSELNGRRKNRKRDAGRGHRRADSLRARATN